MPAHAVTRRSRRTFRRSDGLALALLIVAATLLAAASPRLTASAWADPLELPPVAARQAGVTGHAEARGVSRLEEQMRGLPAGGADSILSHFTASAGQAGDREPANITGHELGWLSFAETRDLSAAYRRCNESQEAGCYHGVLQLYFAEKPRLAANEIAPFCSGGAIDASPTALAHYHCLHGLGHGLAISFDYRLSPPLSYCDLLTTDADRENCYSGVFMEMTSAGRTRASGLGTGDAFFELDVFPRCHALAARYLRSCYILHPFALLIANGGDVPATAAACDLLPAASIAACYQGLGMAITGLAGQDSAVASELCALGAGPYRLWCWAGAIESFLGSPRTADRVPALCRHAPAEIQTFCFESVGETLLLAVADPAARATVCAKAEEPVWIAICMGQAGLPHEASIPSRGAQTY